MPAQSLPQRMVPHECLELTDEVAAAAGGQIGLDPVLEARQPRLLQTGNLRLREAVMAEIGERRPSPQRERLDQPPVLPEPLEALEIELVCVDTQQIPGRFRLETLLSDHLAKLGDVDLNCLVRGLGRIVLPQRLDQTIARDKPVRVEEERGQECALLLRSQVASSPFGEHLERA